MSTLTPISPWHVRLLGSLLLLEAIATALALIYLFPDAPSDAATLAPRGFGWLLGADHASLDRQLLLLALLAGVLGSTLHTMQSFAAFVGDRKLERSWFWWYVLRAPVGALLGFLLYVVTRGGILTVNASGTSDDVNPYGVIAIASLAGWFSKKATDKLAEVFDILFRTASATEFTGKLEPSKRPVLESIKPTTLTAANGGTVILVGKDIATTASAELAGKPLPITRNGDELTVIIPPALLAPGKHPLIVIQSPAPDAPRSESVTLTLS
jgi:hypothetical protein